MKITREHQTVDSNEDLLNPNTLTKNMIDLESALKNLNHNDIKLYNSYNEDGTFNLILEENQEVFCLWTSKLVNMDSQLIEESDNIADEDFMMKSVSRLHAYSTTMYDLNFFMLYMFAFTTHYLEGVKYFTKSKAKVDEFYNIFKGCNIPKHLKFDYEKNQILTENNEIFIEISDSSFKAAKSTIKRMLKAGSKDFVSADLHSVDIKQFVFSGIVTTYNNFYSSLSYFENQK